VLQTGKREVGVIDLASVGNYAVQPTFSDGHDSGIFSWDYLYMLGSQQDDLWARYQQRLQAAGVERDAPMPSKAAAGGGEAARAKHVARGKLPPRERVQMLLDPGTPFLELAPLAAHAMYNGDAPSAGLIAGLVPREIVAHALTVVRALRRRKPVRSVRGRQRVDAPKLRKSSIPGFTAGNLANVGRNRAGRGCITVKAVQFGWKAEPGEDAHGQRQYDHLL
jgi:hypothetical protein